MDRKHIATLTLLLGVALSGSAKDETVMTVNGQPVGRSEFEYLYHKNQQQQVDPQSLEEYAEMFKIYKLKVADALDQKLDTLPAFRKEMEQYRNDLAAPYLTDSLYINSLVEEAYNRSREEVEAYHIMLAKGRTALENHKARELADSIRDAVIGGADFGALAAQYSVDQSSNNSGGRMGYIPEGLFPYDFEVTAYTLKPGEISEIVESGQGYHVLKGGKHRPARGTVLVEHIMKLAPVNATPEQNAKAKAAIDSIYKIVVVNPDAFEEIAREESEDKASAKSGGKLNWFGAGRMVEEFDSVAFAIQVGDISKPVRSQYGWHIIKKLESKAPAGLAEMKPGLIKKVTNPQDPRSRMMRENLEKKLAAKHKGSLNDKNLKPIFDEVSANGLDSAWFAKASDATGLGGIAIANIGKRSISLAEWASTARPVEISDGEEATTTLRLLLNHFLGNELIRTEQDWLYDNEADYRHLLNEYREGSLLYEASLREVWDKASKDTEGLNAYFEAHRGDYKWTKPQAKGILVQAINDSVADLVRNRLAKTIDENSVKAVKKEFTGKANIEPFLCEEGKNAMVDNVVFGGEPVTPSNKKYTVYFVWQPRILTAPESLSDVKSLVTGDYQNQLEKDWVEKLKAKYPVTINAKVLKKIK